jgi:hypothetical protein
MDKVIASPIPSAENIQPSLEPLEISLPLPKSPHTTLHIHLTFLATSVMVFICTTVPGDSGAGEGGALNSMGSFIYAMPDVRFHFLFSAITFFFVAALLVSTHPSQLS